MSMIEELNEKNIRLKSYNPGNHKTTCIRCSHTRTNKSDPCLSVTIEDGGTALWKCHHCLWTGGAGNVTRGAQKSEAKKEYKKPEVKQAQAKEAMPAHVVKYLEGRAITRAVWERNNIYWNPEKSTICFPYFIGKDIVNIKSRTLDKRFFLEKDAQLVFYGLNDVQDADEIIIVEGEFDKLALEVCGKRNVISVPNGAPARIKDEKNITPNGFEYLIQAEAIFQRAKRVLLAVDDDKPGENLRYELARRIGAAKCFVVKFPEKDANGCLQNIGSDIVLDCINDAKPYPIAGLYEVSEFQNTLQEYFDGGMAAGVPTGWENLDRLYSIMPGELTVVTGIPNAGKSELIDALMVNLAKTEDWNFAVFSPENSKEQHVAKLCEKVVGMPTDPRSQNRMNMEQFLNGASWIGKHFYFIVADDGDNLPTIDWILEKAQAAVFRYGIKGIVIDPYNEIEHNRQAGQSETEFISFMLSKVKRFARNHGVHCWLIAHPTKMETDKDGKTKVPSLYNISGSSNWVNKADNGMVIHRSEDAADATEIHVKKVRFKHVGRRGKCELRYEKDTGRYTVPASDIDNPTPSSGHDEDIKTWEV